MKKVVITLTFIIIIAILGVGVYFVLKHTDNLSSEFKTFYVEYDNHHLAAESDDFYCWGGTYRFDIVYPFDFLIEEQKGYTVNIVPNSKADKAEYVIDDRNYLFSGLSDITAAFKIDLNDSFFTLTVPRGFNIKTVLETIYPDKTITIDEAFLNSDAAFYTLIITSYDGTQQCRVNFGIVDGFVKGVTLDITEIVF